MVMRIEVFEEVKLFGRKTCKCARCGKRLRRQMTFWQTLNPYNLRPDGQPKTRADIMAELQAERERWMTEPELCFACREKEQA